MKRKKIRCISVSRVIRHTSGKQGVTLAICQDREINGRLGKSNVQILIRIWQR